MTILLRRSRSRYRIYLLLAIALITTYVFWPKSKDIPSLNQITEKDNSLYHISTEPLRADFNPESNNMEVPHIIEIDEVNKALNTLKLKPLDDEELTQDEKAAVMTPPPEKTNMISDLIINSDYTPIEKVRVFVGNKGVDQSIDYYKEQTCLDITYNAPQERLMSHSKPLLLTDDLDDVKQQLLDTEYKALITLGDKVGDKVEDNWFRFSGASVWLHDEQCHMMVSRVIYAPEAKNNPVASFLRVQLFDSEWKEIIGRRVRYNDVNKNDVDKVLREYNDLNDEKLLDAISIKFPTVLSIPFDPKVKSKELLGPEDPRVLLKDGEFSKEPVVFFNMLKSGTNKRTMNAVFPLRKPNAKTKKCDLVEFKLSGTKALTTLSMEKNWTPFFDTIRIGDSKRSKGYVQFLYTMDPLVIFKCSLDTGKCEKLQDNIYHSQHSQNGKAFIRGGTELAPVPRQVVQLLNNGDTEKRLQMWVAFGKTHIKNCGCGDVTYRPTLVLLIKEDGVFRIELMTDSLDFGIDVQSWSDPKSSKCGSGPNALTPNGISFWSISASDEQSEEEEKPSIPMFKDYMALTVSESDSNVKVIFLKNVINYIFGIYNEGKYMLGDYELEEGVLDRTRKVAECMLESSIQYCQVYGKRHSSYEGATDKTRE
ncbi:glycosyltransferase family 91 protein [[Candida] arabinofermentans NRRL YB-2248]|uniref:Glycosyltransferase family 91 protein n=1 Tax=[Candida] arabinofermentans NRRL YB-2248 TaxID=983967 RepID=A0A1E4T4X6_9ASCO|nr:glycosyltransferase family 91 protein [[Candida] arabinofermentans NRRL YB-2248]